MHSAICPYPADSSRSRHDSTANLEFVAAPALAPPEVAVDAGLMEMYNKELAAAAAAPLPDEDDTDI